MEKLKNTKIGLVMSRANHKIACLGPEGTFSYLVAARIFPGQQYLLCKTIGQVFATVKNKKANYGIVPIENAIGGIIQETIDQFYINKVRVVGSYRAPIRHCLLARTTNRKKIKIIRSHNQALNQCKEWLAKNFPDAVLVSENSSVQAMLSNFKKDTAFVSSKEAARKYGLKVLAEDIQDYKNNFTEFYVIAKVPRHQPSKKLKASNSIMIITVKDRPGVLRDILNAFADRELNLAKLHSRFNIFKGRDYYFFLEVESLPENKNFKSALKEMHKYCTDIKLLGVV